MDWVMGSYNLRKNSQENYMTYLNIWLGTDSLYLAPMQYRENKNSYLELAPENGEHYGLSFQEINRTTTQNANKIFSTLDQL